MIRNTAVMAMAMLCAGSVVAQDRPTMGWSSWNTFALNISEQIIKNQAVAMKQSGLLKAGYDHINIDDGYSLSAFMASPPPLGCPISTACS